MRVSFLIPAYNESRRIGEVLDRVAALPLDKQVIVVDDGSTDDTAAMVEARDGVTPPAPAQPGQGRGHPPRHRAHRRRDRGHPGRRHGVRPGRGAAADRADRARGRRRRLRLAPARRRGPARVHVLAPGRQPLPLAADRRPLQHDDLGHGDRLQGVPVRGPASLDLRQSDFAIEPEITAKVCLRNLRVYELPISYYGRTYEEGKNITWRDGFKAVWVLFATRVRGR